MLLFETLRTNLHIQSGLLLQIYLLFCGQNLKILFYVVYGTELNKTFELSHECFQYFVQLETIRFIADLVCKSNVLQMKRLNGYYGCTLCEMRGKHQFRSHSYAHNEEKEMRNPDHHYRQAVYFERGDVEEMRKNKEKDPEIKTKGVQGNPEIFKVLSDVPLFAPVDTMHELLKGVAKDLLEVLFEVSGYPVEIENAAKALKLPSEF